KEWFVVVTRALLQRFQTLRFIKRVDLRCDNELRSRCQILVVRRELAIHSFVITDCIAARHRRNIDEMQQQLRALDVSQETIAQTSASVRALNQSGNIGDHESTKVTEIDNTKMRLQSRERIISDLRSRRGDSRDKRRLSRIRKTNQTNVREQLQLELHIQLFTLAARLMVARRAIRRSRKVGVAETAAATARRQPAITVVTQVVQQVTCARVKDLCSNWNPNNQVFAVMARAIRSLAVQTTLGDVAGVVTQMQQCVQRSIRDEDLIAATAAVSARWTTAGHKLLAPESRNTVTSVSPLHMNLGAINKHLKLKTTPKRA